MGKCGTEDEKVASHAAKNILLIKTQIQLELRRSRMLQDKSVSLNESKAMEIKIVTSKSSFTLRCDDKPSSMKTTIIRN